MSLCLVALEEKVPQGMGNHHLALGQGIRMLYCWPDCALAESRAASWDTVRLPGQGFISPNFTSAYCPVKLVGCVLQKESRGFKALWHHPVLMRLVNVYSSLVSSVTSVSESPGLSPNSFT